MFFKYGCELADWQEDKINRVESDVYGATDTVEIRQNRNNLYIIAARVLAPSNLIIRQYCIEDIYLNCPAHLSEIIHLYKMLSLDGIIWLEGYSYWLYTRRALDLYIKHFKAKYLTEVTILDNLINKTYDGFITTSYQRNGIKYPALFGDLREIPIVIEEERKGFLKGLTVEESTRLINHIVITRDDYYTQEYTSWIIIPHGRGFNSHIPHKKYFAKANYHVANGVALFVDITGFKFFTGKTAVKYYMQPFCNIRGWWSILTGKTL